MLTLEQINRAVGKTLAGQPLSNAMSVLVALDRFGVSTGINLPHREVQFLAQLAHESMGFVYDKEIWGPTDAQKRYDTRTDLGNTAAVDGDGFRYRGRGPIQTTGKANYSAFTKWARALDAAAPDFVATPDLLNTDPWEGLSAIWYWSTRTSGGKSMNDYADAGDNEMVTRIINGGTNGLADRLNWYTRIGLVALGYGPTEVRAFQTAAGLFVDGAPGTKTRAAIHAKLKAMPAAPIVVAPPAPEPPIEVSLTSLDARLRLLETSVAGLISYRAVA